MLRRGERNKNLLFAPASALSMFGVPRSRLVCRVMRTRPACIAFCLLPALVTLASGASAADPVPPPLPATTASAPPPGYGQAPPGYGQPQPGYGQPPPGYGQPPPGYYPPPGGYPAPPGYGQPYYQPQDTRPRVLDYEDGEPIPSGYHVRSKVRTGLIGGGAGMLGGMWLVSTLMGLVGDGWNDPGDGGWAALYIPVVGPFAAIATLHADSTGAAFLALDGLVQVGGAAMIVLGVALPKKTLIRDDLGKSTLTLRPVLTGNGMAFSGTF